MATPYGLLMAKGFRSSLPNTKEANLPFLGMARRVSLMVVKNWSRGSAGGGG